MVKRSRAISASLCSGKTQGVRAALMWVVGWALLVGLVASSGAEVAVSRRLEPLPVAQALAFKRLSYFDSITASRDGVLVAYTIQDTGRAETALTGRAGQRFAPSGATAWHVATDIYVTHLLSGEMQVITGGMGANYAPSWSPASRTLAFYSDRDGRLGLWTWSRASGELRRIADVQPFTGLFNSAPSWADEQTLLVPVLREGVTYAQQERALVEQPNPVTPLVPGSSVKVYSHEHDPQGSSVESLMLHGYGGGSLPNVDWARIDLTTGSYERIIRNQQSFGAFLSNDGEYVLFTRRDGVDPTNLNDARCSLLVFAMQTGRQVMALHDVPMQSGCFSVSWSPTGARFAYVTGTWAESAYQQRAGSMKGARTAGDVYVVDVSDGGEPVNVTPGDHPSFSSASPPVWSSDGDELFLTGGGQLWRADVASRSVRVVARHKGYHILNILTAARGTQAWRPGGSSEVFALVNNSQTMIDEVHRIDLVTGKFVPAANAARAYSSAGGGMTFDAGHASGPGVFMSMTASQPPDLYVTKDFENARRLTRLNPLFDRYRLGQSSLVSWNGRDGKRYQGSLLLPADYEAGKRYPLIVWQRPSNRGSYALNVFGLLNGEPHLQLLATRGYAVFYPDFPAQGYLDVKRGMEEVVLPGIERLVEMGVVDDERVGLTGQSWGGYSTFLALTLTDRFKVAVAEAGPSDLFQAFFMFQRDGRSWRVQETISATGGTPWDATANYVEYSPMLHVNRIKTPLMIVAASGDNDYGVPQSIVDPMFVGLRYLNRTATMLLYEGGHGISSYSHPDQVDCWLRMIAWYDRFLRG